MATTATSGSDTPGPRISGLKLVRLALRDLQPSLALFDTRSVPAVREALWETEWWHDLSEDSRDEVMHDLGLSKVDELIREVMRRTPDADTGGLMWTSVPTGTMREDGKGVDLNDRHYKRTPLLTADDLTYRAGLDLEVARYHDSRATVEMEAARQLRLLDTGGTGQAHKYRDVREEVYAELRKRGYADLVAI